MTAVDIAINAMNANDIADLVSSINVGSGTSAVNDAKDLADRQRLDPARFDKEVREYLAKKDEENKTAVSQISPVQAVQNTALSKTYGATPTQIARHIDNISRGNAPPNSSAHALGGFSTSGSRGFSTNAAGDVIGGKAAEQIKEATELGLDISRYSDNLTNGFADKDLQSQIDRAKAEVDTAPEVDKGGAETSIEAGYTYKGGCIPKRIKQKKMKRGGLASR